MIDYTKYLDIRKIDRFDEIESIVQKELSLIKEVDGSYEGICKLVANNIKSSLNENGIRTYIIDLNQFKVDHVSLICEYYVDCAKRVLIDPTISQFKIYPKSYLKNKALIDNLNQTGLSLINEADFNNYISLFTGEKMNINLDEFLLGLKQRDK